MRKGRIYKIINTKTTDIYVGCTVQELKARFKAHKSNAKANHNGLLYDCIRKYGVENFSIELIEEIDINNIGELHAKEKEYYEKLKPSLNMIAPKLTSIKQTGLIYKIVDIDDQTKFYIGSTTTSLTQRFVAHKSAAKNGTTPIYKYMKERGVEKFIIENVEDMIPIDNLTIRENHWLQSLNPPLNTHLFLCRTEQDRDKARYENNKEKIKNRVSTRRIEKREEINLQKKEHYQKNKETILAKMRTEEYKNNANAKRRERNAKKKNLSVTQNTQE
jgi:hypothetical protein